MHKCIIFAIFAANLSDKVQKNNRKRSLSYPDKYKQLKNNISNETLSTQILQVSPSVSAPTDNLMHQSAEALRHRRVAMLRGRVAREAERGATHRRTLLQRCRPAHQFG